MIFQHTWRKVLSGQKVQTRRPARATEELMTIEHRHKAPEKVLFQGRRTKWRTGHSYAVQPGRGQKAVGRIRLLDIRYQLLGSVSEEEASAEGYPSLEAFQEAWRKIHGVFKPEQAVWALEFRLVDKHR